MIWIPVAFLALYAVLLAVAAFHSGRTDAAGRGLEVAFLAAAVAVWGVLAAVTALGNWVGPRFLIWAPVAPLAVVPVVWTAGFLRRSLGLARSTMPTPGLRRLEQAAREGDATRARELLASGTRIETAEIGRELLHAALDGRYARDVVPVLLEAGADPRDAALVAKVLVSRTTDLGPFLKHGADPNAILPDGERLLFKALEGGWTQNVIALVEAGVDLEARDRDGWNPLMAHATGRRGLGPGNWAGVHDLLERGADPKVPAPDGTTLADLFRRTPPSQVHDDLIDAIRRRLGL